MDPLVNVIVHHTTLMNLFMSVSLLAYSIGFTVYKKRHNNQLPQGRTRNIILVFGGAYAVFGAFVVGVLAAH